MLIRISRYIADNEIKLFLSYWLWMSETYGKESRIFKHRESVVLAWTKKKGRIFVTRWTPVMVIAPIQSDIRPRHALACGQALRFAVKYSRYDHVFTPLHRDKGVSHIIHELRVLRKALSNNFWTLTAKAKFTGGTLKFNRVLILLFTIEVRRSYIIYFYSYWKDRYYTIYRTWQLSWW